MRLSPDYTPLLVACAEGTTDTQLKQVERAIREWNWKDPVRKRRLPDLMRLVKLDGNADAIVHFVEDVDDVLLAHGARVILKDSAQGATVTDPREHCVQVYIDANAHKTLGPGWYSGIIAHELGHAGGLRHSDAAVPTGIMQANLVGGLDIAGPHDNRNPLDKGGTRLVAQAERERLHALRLEGVVGVDSLEGN